MNNVREWIEYSNIHLSLKFPKATEEGIITRRKIYTYQMIIGIADSLRPINSSVPASQDAHYSFNIMFYSQKTRMFYGRQFFSKSVYSPNPDKVMFDQTVFFISRYDDPSCMAIIEFVVEDEGTIKSCGYSVVPIFDNPSSSEMRQIYGESVRSLLSPDHTTLGHQYSQINISARRYDAKGHILKWYLPENCPFSKYDFPPGIEFDGKGNEIEDIHEISLFSLHIATVMAQIPMQFDQTIVTHIQQEYKTLDLPTVKERIAYLYLHNGWTIVGPRKQVILENKSSDLLVGYGSVELQRFNKDIKTAIIFELVYNILINGEIKSISCGCAISLPNLHVQNPPVDTSKDLQGCKHKAIFCVDEYPPFYNQHFKFAGEFLIGFDISRGERSEAKEESGGSEEEEEEERKFEIYQDRTAVKPRRRKPIDHSPILRPGERYSTNEPTKQETKASSSTSPSPTRKDDLDKAYPSKPTEVIRKEETKPVEVTKKEQFMEERKREEEEDRRRSRRRYDDEYDDDDYYYRRDRGYRRSRRPLSPLSPSQYSPLSSPYKPQKHRKDSDFEVESDSGDDLEDQMLTNPFLSKAMKTLLQPKNLADTTQPFLLQQVKHYTAYQPPIIGTWDNGTDLNITTNYTKPMTRAAKAELAKYGITGNNGNVNPYYTYSNKNVQSITPELTTQFQLEESDINVRNLITIHFSMIETFDDIKLPSALYFQFKFYTFDEFTSKNHYLQRKNDNLSMLVSDMSSVNPPVCLPYKSIIDYSELPSNELSMYYDYMTSKSLYINVYDGESKLFIGYMLLPLKQLLRQQKPYVSTSQYYTINAVVSNGETPIEITNNTITHPILGKVVITTCCTGEKGRGNSGGGGGGGESKISSSGTSSLSASVPIHSITTNKEYFTKSYGVKSDVKVPIRVRLMEEVDPNLRETLTRYRSENNVPNPTIHSDESEIPFSTLDIIMQRYKNIDQPQTMSGQRLYRVIIALTTTNSESKNDLESTLGIIYKQMNRANTIEEIRSAFLEYDRRLLGEVSKSQFRRVCENFGLESVDLVNELEPFLKVFGSNQWDYESFLCLLLEQHSRELHKIIQRFKNMNFGTKLIKEIFDSCIGRCGDHLTKDDLIFLLAQFNFKFVQNFESGTLATFKETQIKRIKEREMRSSARSTHKTYREESLQLIKEARERQKQEILRSLMREREIDIVQIHPFMGQLFFFEWRFKNPASSEELFEIEIVNDRSLQLILSRDEWKYYKQNCKQSENEVPTTTVEDGLITSENILYMHANETVYIPFKYITYKSPRLTPYKTKYEEENDVKDIKVIFRGRNSGISISLTVRVYPVKTVINRHIILSSPENEVLRQNFVIKSPSTNLMDDNNINNIKFAFSPSDNALVQWSEPIGPQPQIIHMKYRCGSLKQGKEVFYIFIYDDELHTQLYEIWKITINIVEDCSFILKLGQMQTKELHFQTNGSRVVQGFANDNKFIKFLPDTRFRTNTGDNILKVILHPLQYETFVRNINIIDVDTGDLIGSWKLVAAIQPPPVTREYNIRLDLYKPAKRIIQYLNPWKQNRSYRLFSSDESLLRVECKEFRVEAGQSGEIRLFFPAQDIARSATVYIFVNGEAQKTDECLQVNIVVGSVV